MLIYLSRAAEGAEATPPQTSDSDAPKPHPMYGKHSNLTLISVHQDALNPNFPRAMPILIVPKPRSSITLFIVPIVSSLVYGAQYV